MKTTKKDALVDFDDFGFSFSDDTSGEVNAAKEDIATLNSEIDTLNGRIEQLHSVFIQFLDNLSKNPEQASIVWPNRVEKIKDFKEVITKIKEGKI